VTAYLGLADCLLIAEAVLGLPAELIADFNRIGLADSALAAPQAGFGGVEAYPDFATKAAASTSPFGPCRGACRDLRLTARRGESVRAVLLEARLG
jgi:hypothetical protein